MVRTLTLWLLLCTPLLASEAETVSHAVDCESRTPSSEEEGGLPSECRPLERIAPDAWSVGLDLRTFIPTQLPQFGSSILTYGPTLTVPFLGQSLLVGASYGGDNSISAKMVELSYRLILDTPFLRHFLRAGFHYLFYSVSSQEFAFFGAHAGVGFLFPMTSTFEVKVEMTAFQHSSPALSFGGGLHVAL